MVRIRLAAISSGLALASVPTCVLGYKFRSGQFGYTTFDRVDDVENKYNISLYPGACWTTIKVITYNHVLYDKLIGPAGTNPYKCAVKKNETYRFIRPVHINCTPPFWFQGMIQDIYWWGYVWSQKPEQTW